MNNKMIGLIVAALLSANTLAKPASDEHEHKTNEDQHQHANHQEEDHHEHETHDKHQDEKAHDESEHGQQEHYTNHDEEENGGRENESAESDHSHGHGDHEESNSVELNSQQMQLASIQVEQLTAQKVDYQLYAPGEILSNGYTSYRVSPRVASVVVRRHVALGDHVDQGQALITLFSEEVAQAQAAFRKAEPEWRRVQKLGRKTVGDRRYIDAKTSFAAAKATLLAYGLSLTDIEQLTKQASPQLGEYTLYAKTSGAVLADNFEQGQRIDPGAPLITLANEKLLWVEARLPANLAVTLNKGLQANIVVGDYHTQGSVSQEAHTIDPQTRTRVVRLVVENREHRLHPGQFAEVYFRFKTQDPVLAVPETALMRGADGDWTVYVGGDHAGEFEPKEVELGRSLGNLREITGIKAGSRIVTQGAFFVASQMAKGGFDPHNH